MRFSEIQNGKRVYRFEEDKSFAYWAYNLKRRKQIADSSYVYKKHCSEDRDKTVGDVLDEIDPNNQSECFKLLKKFSYWTSSIQGSPGYLADKGKDLRAAIDELGCATAFETFSAADQDWKPLHLNLSGKDTIPTQQERRELLQKYPVQVDEFFRLRFEAFFEKLKEVLGID